MGSSNRSNEIAKDKLDEKGNNNKKTNNHRKSENDKNNEGHLKKHSLLLAEPLSPQSAFI